MVSLPELNELSQKKFEYFKEMFQWTISPKMFGDLIRCRRQKFTYGSSIKGKPFAVRLLVADIWTTLLLLNEDEKSNLDLVRMATLEEDYNFQIDHWTMDGNEQVAEQFKVRDGYEDINCVRFQPYWGLDNPETEEGRDYRCLKQQRTRYHRIAIWDSGRFRRIHKILSKELWERVNKLDKEWNFQELNSSNNTFVGSDGAEVKWQHNPEVERYPKYNFYVPTKAFDFCETTELGDDESVELVKLYDHAWYFVVQKYI